MKVIKFIYLFFFSLFIYASAVTSVGAAVDPYNPCPSVSGSGPSTCATDSTGVYTSWNPTICATTYTAYLSMDPMSQSSLMGGYNDSTYTNPPRTFYYNPVPVAGVMTASGLPLCAGKYSVKVSLGMVGGSCGGASCCFHIRLYAGNNVLISDPNVGCINQSGGNNYAVLTYTSTSSEYWNTSTGPLYPPMIRGNSSDQGALATTITDSYITLTAVP